MKWIRGRIKLNNFFHNFTAYITDFFEAEPSESMYPNIVKFAREGVVPERAEPSVLDVEVDLCIMEWDVDFSVRNAPDLIRKYEVGV